jgi:hypothetical protein
VQVVRTNADLLHFHSAPSALESRIGGVDLIGAKVAAQASVRNAAISKCRFIAILLFFGMRKSGVFSEPIVSVIGRWFQRVFAEQGKWFRPMDKSLRGRLADETSSQDRDHNTGC